MPCLALTRSARFLAATAMALALAGCLSPAQRAQRLEDEYGERCRALGQAANDADYQSCLRALRNTDLATDLQDALNNPPLR